ncbi:MAG: hypothetical protein IKS28_05460 [Clostridia bacterium]|nr:hypothetical protein [Clostridia bacterium]
MNAAETEPGFALPPLRPDNVFFNWFPTDFHCFVYRNWGMVSPEKMAEVSGTDVFTVKKAAAEMGLPDICDSGRFELWKSRGYITLIRANWHILTYGQICILLDIDLRRLSYILKEEDFLGEKLGGFKPDVKPLSYEPPCAGSKRRTGEIKETTARLLSSMPSVSAEPFDFDFSRAEKTAAGSERFGEIICYAYGAPCGDDFLSDAGLIDQSFPDGLLSSYSSAGVTALWVPGILYRLSEFPFSVKLSDGYEKRTAGLRYLAEKLKRHGLKLYMYLNEPRAMNVSFFDEYPDLLGVTEGEKGTLCISERKVRDWLSDAVYRVVRAIPGLNGIITITASENLTNCFSHIDRNPCRCRRCSSQTPAEHFAEVNRIIAEGALRANPDIEMIAWNWGWEEKTSGDVIRLLPQGFSVMCVSEQGCGKKIGDTETHVLDYSISVEGPGEYALNTWSAAAKSGRKAYAKIQINNSWECSAVPYIPAFEKTYRHLRRLYENHDVSSLMISWTLGGYPSPFMRAVECFGKGGNIPSFEDCCAAAFPCADPERLAEVFGKFSDAFDEFPFSLGSVYSGPQQLGPANPLFEEKTGMRASMVGYPYDDLESWASVFPEETYIDQLRRLSEKWAAGLELLRSVKGNGRDISLLRAVSETCFNHFRSSYLQAQFCSKRNRGEAVDGKLLDEEITLALSQAKIAREYPEIGYEPSNHYYYTEYMLFEKVICCEYLKKRINTERG